MISIAKEVSSGVVKYIPFKGCELDVFNFYDLKHGSIKDLTPLLSCEDLVLFNKIYESIAPDDEVFFKNVYKESNQLCKLIADAVKGVDMFIKAGDFSSVHEKTRIVLAKTKYIYFIVHKLYDASDKYYCLTIFLGTDDKYVKYRRSQVISSFLENYQNI